MGHNHTPDEVLEPRSVDDLKDADAFGHAIDIEEVSFIGMQSDRCLNRGFDWSVLLCLTNLNDLYLLLLGRDHSLPGLRWLCFILQLLLFISHSHIRLSHSRDIDHRRD